jgi:uncharacterized protein (DUF1800 family)
MNRKGCLLPAVAVASVLLAPAQAQQRHAIPASPNDKTIVHVLNRIGFGPAPGDVDAVRRIGLAAYIDRQLQPERLSDSGLADRLASFSTLQLTTRELAERYYIPALMERQQRQRQQGTAPGAAPADSPPPVMEAERGERRVFAELAQQKILRAVYSERQLEEVMVDFWFNHFNVFGGKGPTRMYLTEYERDVIRPHALGRFRDLLHATAKSPAMLFYLDNWQSAAPGQADDAITTRGRATRARGRVLVRRPPQPQRPGQNRRRDINENYARELMELHTLGVDGGYTQKDVQEVARAFTGWTILQPRAGGEFRFEPRMHDRGEKAVLGHRIKAGGGMEDGEQVLDLLARHPSTARFIAAKLARRFVADEPPAALVTRAAARFTDTNGDIREVLRAIVTSPEFFAPAAYRAKVKTPLEFVASAVRATGINLPNAMPAVQALRELGMPPYMCEPPTGYADEAKAWVNTGALLNRMNFALALTSGRDGRGRDRAQATAPAATTADAVIENALANDISESTRSTIAKASTPAQAAALALGSPEFQRR